MKSPDFDSVNTMTTVTYEERFEDYVTNNLTSDEYAEAISNADVLQTPGKPLAETIALIPVAAHQDADLIRHDMSLYASQLNTDPFSVVLYLNTPQNNESNENIKNALEQVELAKEDNPNLDIRAIYGSLEKPTIGLIRRQMWASVLVLLQREGTLTTPARDVIGLNNDIDMIRISPHYVSRIQRHFNDGWKKYAQASVEYPVARPANTRLSLATLPTHPNVGKVTAWIDETRFQTAGHVGHEPGMVFPFAFYMQRGGFDAKSWEHETYWTAGSGRDFLADAQIWGSPRRFIGRLAEHGRHRIWGEGSFKIVDPLRETLPPDLSKDQVDLILRDGLSDDIEKWINGGVTRAWKRFKATSISDSVGQTGQELAVVSHAVETQLRKAETFMRIVTGSSVLANLIKDSFDASELTKKYHQKLTEQIKSTTN